MGGFFAKFISIFLSGVSWSFPILISFDCLLTPKQHHDMYSFEEAHKILSGILYAKFDSLELSTITFGIMAFTILLVIGAISEAVSHWLLINYFRRRDKIWLLLNWPRRPLKNRPMEGFFYLKSVEEHCAAEVELMHKPQKEIPSSYVTKKIGDYYFYDVGPFSFFLKSAPESVLRWAEGHYAFHSLLRNCSLSFFTTAVTVGFWSYHFDSLSFNTAIVASLILVVALLCFFKAQYYHTAAYDVVKDYVYGKYADVLEQEVVSGKEN